jgi:hypothetical protein
MCKWGNPTTIAHAHQPIAEPTNAKRTNQRDHASIRSPVCQSTTPRIDGISTTNAGSAIHATPITNVQFNENREGQGIGSEKWWETVWDLVALRCLR